MTLVVGLLHGAAFLSNLPLVLFLSFIGPQQLERTPSKPKCDIRNNSHIYLQEHPREH